MSAMTTPIELTVTLTDEQDQTLACQLLHSAIPDDFVIVDTPSQTTHTITHFIDGRTLACPQPLLRTKRAFKSINNQDYLYLVATDTNALTDITAFSHHAHLDCYWWQHTLCIGSDEKILHFLLKNDKISKEI